MELEIKNGSEFVDGFIGVLARISETGIIKLTGKKFTCLTATADNTIVINSEYTDENIHSDNDIILDIPDFKKLHKLFSILPDSFKVKIDTNSISYSSQDTRFKFHLFDEGIISSPAINVNKINTIPFNCKFNISVENIKSLMKSSFLLPDITKVYFNFSDGAVHGEITDKSRHNVDSFSRLLCSEIEGEQFTKSVPINIEILRLLTSVNQETLQVQYSKEYSILTFDVRQTNLYTRYIVSGLIN